MESDHEGDDTKTLYADVRRLADEAASRARAYRAAGKKRQAGFETGRQAAFIDILHVLHDDYVPREWNDSLDLLGRERFLAGEADSAARAAGIATDPRDEKSTAPQPVPDPDPFDPPISRMRASGYRAGRAAGRAVVSDRTTPEECEEILLQIDDGEFEVPAPLSGEWTPQKAYEDAGVSFHDDTDPIGVFPELAAWEDAYREGFEYQAEIDAESAHDGPNVLRKQTHNPTEEK